MAGLNVLTRFGSRICGSKTRVFCALTSRTGIQNNLQCIPSNLGVVARSMGGAGGKRTMKVTGSRHEWRIFKDQLHFYVMLGAIPLGGVILYSNMVVGPATLSDIPEGYQPERWEYYKHPIQRWFARYVYSPPEKTYEIALHHVDLEQQKVKLKKLETKVRNIMKERGDYKDWYYVDVLPRRQMRGREYHEDVQENWSMPEKMKGHGGK